MVSLVRWEDWGWASFMKMLSFTSSQYELFLSLLRLLCYFHAESPTMNLIRLMCQAGDAWKKKGLKLSSEPRPSAFITSVFTFISTCLKCVMSALLSILSLCRTPYIHLGLASLQTDAIKQRKCFVCFPLARQILPSRLYMSTSRGTWQGQMETSMQSCRAVLVTTKKNKQCAKIHLSFFSDTQQRHLCLQ